MKVIAIDFETANERRNSPCAVGLAWIEENRVVRRHASLIRPAEMRFLAGNIGVHGIRPRDVEDAPAFPEAMAALLPEIDGALMLAHNASFDVGVLAATLAAYGLPQPAYTSLCTLQLARRLWPGQPRYRLSALAERVGVTFRHHDAGEDAYACAEIALAVQREAGAADLPALARQTGLARVQAPRSARSEAGLAARALRSVAAPASRPAQEIRFVVRGSRGTPYDVTLVKGRDGYRLRCTCVGARFRPDCRHVVALANGEVEHLISGDLAAVAALPALLGLDG